MAKTLLGGSGTEARLRVAMIHALLTEQLIRVSEMCLVGAPAKYFRPIVPPGPRCWIWPVSCSSCCRRKDAADQVEAERKTKEILSATLVAIGR